MQTKIVSILGTRGIPSNHGGFETFAQDLGLYLSERGWTVNVYCQKIGKGKTEIEIWKGIQLIKIYIKKDTNYGTLLFDLKSIIHSLRNKGIFLTLGYNTAILNLIYKVFRKVNIINMDGIEWKRRKWGFFIKSWFWINV